MNKLALIIVILTSVFLKAYSQDGVGSGKVVYKYKKYEKFNLGDMSIKGDVLTPGDISVKERNFIEFQEGLFDRKHFRDFISQDIKDLR